MDFTPDWLFSLPIFWASAKSYHELKGSRHREVDWLLPYVNAHRDIEDVKNLLDTQKPDVLGASLFVWNFRQSMELLRWFKERYPNAIVITGGPHQYLNSDTWFSDNTFIDASLDGSSYGEVTICDLLDNIDDGNHVDWASVTGVTYPSGDRLASLKSPKQLIKKDFFWRYSPYLMQEEHLRNIIGYAKSVIKDHYWAMAKLETTRGCPYACTFCDWGGGTASKVIAKDLDVVMSDIDTIERLGVNHLIICDANFGILGKRDLTIIDRLVDGKSRYQDGYFTLSYAGLAKTMKHSEFFTEIIRKSYGSMMMYTPHYKASVQTIHDDVLRNVKRSDVPFSKHLEMAEMLKKSHGKISAYAECIAGLPGMTPDKWYHEIDEFTRHDVYISLYVWEFLPETPAYDPSYREEMKLKIHSKAAKWSREYQQHYKYFNTGEYVVGTFSYDDDGYKSIWMSWAIYAGLWYTGILKDTMECLHRDFGIGYGKAIKMLYEDLFRSKAIIGTELKRYVDMIDGSFNRFFDPSDETYFLSVQTEYGEVETPVSFFCYLVDNHLEFYDILKRYIKEKIPSFPMDVIDSDQALFITTENIGLIEGVNGEIVHRMNDDLAKVKRNRKSLVKFLVETTHAIRMKDLLRSTIRYDLSDLRDPS